jgi:hypothetical protein
MKISGKEGGPIDRAIAKRWTANYRRAGRGKVRSHLFGVETIQQILGQEGCVGMKAYYALDDDGQEQLLLVGTDAEGNELQEGLIMDKSKVCPPECGSTGELDG